MLFNDDPEKDEQHSAGRSFARKRDAEGIANERSRKVAKIPGQDAHGMTVKDRIAFAAFQVQTEQLDRSRKEAKLIALRCQSQLVNERITRAQNRNDNDKVDMLEVEMDDIYSKMKALAEQTPEKKKRSFHDVFDVESVQLLPSSSSMHSSITNDITTPAKK